MANDVFSAAEERIGKFNLSQIHTAEEWQIFIDDGIGLLDHPDDRKKEYAIERMQKAIWSENSQQYNQPNFQPAPAAQRLIPILDAIAKQDAREHCLLRLTMSGSLSEDQKEVLSQWLKAAETHGTLSADAVATAKIQAGIYPTEDWIQAKSFLEPFFDHPNDLLRAAAAALFGEMYLNGADNLPPLVGVMQQVKDREIERPGFAGAFLGQLLMIAGKDGEIEASGVKLTDWILEIIAKRQTDEPYVPFYNGIDFYAHEILSCNPEAVRKLMEFGAESVAAMAATEEDCPIAGMQELLEQLAHSSDGFVSRVCSWQLAYHYRSLHPEAQRRGYVQLAEREDVAIFLVFDPEEYGDRPYAATIYPRESALSDDVAWKWIDRLIPPDVRPPMKDNEKPYPTLQVEPACAMYDYGAYVVDLFGDSENKQWDRVWVKWPLRSSKW
jgi:hypothetical protein